jgi:hypothetical protein
VSDSVGNNPSGRPPRRGDEARLDALIDAFFDKDLDADRSGSLFKGLRADPAKAREFAATRRFVEELRAPVDGPDLTANILGSVHTQRPWLRDRQVWGVRLGRLGLVAMLLLVLGGVLLQRRATPDAPVWNAGPAPLTDLVRSSGEATQRTRENAQAALTNFRVDSSIFGVAQPSAATTASFKPVMPDLPHASATYLVSFKPVEERCTRRDRASDSRSGRFDRDVVILRLDGVESGREVGATLISFPQR